METGKLKRFAQFARRNLIEQISAKLVSVLDENSAARRENLKAIGELSDAIAREGDERLIKQVAYAWFNRFCALRFMDVARYTRIGVVSPVQGQFQPEILAEAKMGHVDEGMFNESAREHIFALLEGKTASRDPQSEAYRLLVVGACNYWHRTMPFLFEQINDYTELLMPDDLLSGNSILAYTREAMTPDTCEDVEVIGWLYQFYISEEKDEVFAGLKKNKKITPEKIPVATQLFTPHWIVRYLVENSLGRLWMINRPGSKLAEHMDYYIKQQPSVNTEEKDRGFLQIKRPEEIKICDPACGSGHMLICAFDLLHLIYEEEGYEPAEIPEKILTHNLYGIEIDERAGELAAFALAMKACKKQRRFLSKPVQPNICVLENISFDKGELEKYMEFAGEDLFTPLLLTTLHQFEEADNFGSLIRPDFIDVLGVRDALNLNSEAIPKDLFRNLSLTHDKVMKVLRQADYLSPKYHLVITNPPYMGSSNMNLRLKSWTKENYPNGKGRSDLYAAFIERNLNLAMSRGKVAMITRDNWMFLSSYELLRIKILEQNTIISMAHLGARAFDNIGGEVVSTTAFVLKNVNCPEYKGAYLRLIKGNSEKEKETTMLRTIQNPDSKLFFKVKPGGFLDVSGKPIAYWISDNLRALFRNEKTIGYFFDSKAGVQTSNNNQFLRLWYEVNFSEIKTDLSRDSIEEINNVKWVRHQKGGTFRRWYGNNEWVINWKNDGKEIREFGTEGGGKPRSAVRNPDFYFRPGITWSKIATGKYAGRYFEPGFIFDVASPALFPKKTISIQELNSYVNSTVFQRFLDVLSSGVNYDNGVVGGMPCVVSKSMIAPLEDISKKAVQISKKDWNSYETSWDFTNPPLLLPNYRSSSLKATYQTLRKDWKKMVFEMQQIEEYNNCIFIEACGLQDELTSEVALNEITLICNPSYRYGGDKNEDELESMLLADTVRELVSYAVGCMFGRYALEKSGLILANQGETIEDYLNQVPNPCFPADDDNVIPILGDDWFTDDIVGRFRIFLRTAFGEESYEENLNFVETALGKNGKPKDIRSYFLRDFYVDHVKRYKKRPIYWLFSSRNGSFNALIYMHRYRPDTVSVVLNDYLREFRTKLVSHKNQMEAMSISGAASQGEKTKAFKEVERVKKMIAETEEYEREVLYPLATQQIEIDLDDGVGVNYPKFGKALKNILGLSAEN